MSQYVSTRPGSHSPRLCLPRQDVLPSPPNGASPSYPDRRAGAPRPLSTADVGRGPIDLHVRIPNHRFVHGDFHCDAFWHCINGRLTIGTERRSQVAPIDYFVICRELHYAERADSNVAQQRSKKTLAGVETKSDLMTEVYVRDTTHKSRSIGHALRQTPQN
jgi:hypothetical protein